MYDDRRTMRNMSLYHPATEDLALPAVLHALSDPQRLQIVRELNVDPTPRPCGSFELGVSKSTCTHHFRVLREAGVINQAPQRRQLRGAEQRFPGLLDAVLGAVAVSA